MPALLRVISLAFLALWFSLSALAAQELSTEDFASWEVLAKRAEQSVDAARASDSAFEVLRGDLADFRARFDNARGANNARISTLRKQIAALGQQPEGEGAAPESVDVTAKRADLNDQLNTLLLPVQRAEAAYVRANHLVGEIDQILRDRQARQLLSLSPSPLNPVHWKPAAGDCLDALWGIWNENPRTVQARSLQELRTTGPVVLLLLVLGGVLILRGRAWARAIVGQLRKYGERGIGLWGFVLSLLRIILPFIGMLLLALAAISTQLFGTKGHEILLSLALMGGILMAVRWVSERVFSADQEEALIALPEDQRSKMRFYVAMITTMIMMGELVLLVFEIGTYPEASENVLIFPFLLVSSLSLYRIGGMMRGYEEWTQTGEEEPRATSMSRVVRWLGTGARVVGALSPLLMAAGYFNAAEALLPPYIVTLVLLGLVLVLQRFLADVYGAITGQGSAAREALLPVLMGMVLLILVAPFLALAWGARVTDLTELWDTIGRGFAIGDTRISPSDFLVFAIIFVIGYILTRLVQSALRNNVLPKTRIDIGGQNAIVSGLGYVGIFLAALAAITGAGIDLSSLAIVAGALSVGIGFGLQNIVSNFVSGIILLIERPISEGDWIEVGGQMGYVRDISVRSTRIETFDKTDVIVPNADLVSGTVTNFTRGNTVGRVIVPVGVAYGTDTRQVEGILREIAEAHPMVLLTPPPSVLLLNFGADALEFEVRCVLRDVNFMMVVKNDINHEIVARFTAAGIEIPFAQRDVWLRNPEVLRHDAHVPTEVTAPKGAKT
ncbi:MAG: DUF3772 domain-containing protein [Sulfitobacter sp.]